MNRVTKETVATRHDIELLRRDMKIWAMGQSAIIISILAAIKFFG